MRIAAPKLQLAPDLFVGPEIATSTCAFVGTRGSGKTYGAGVLVEELDRAELQFCVVDPVGVWYGLRLAADGKKRGLEVPVFGGLHADVPLEAAAGDVVGKLLVESGRSMILDVSMMELREQRRFVTDFARSVFNRKKSARSPLHLVFDEAHEFVPQERGPEDNEVLGAVRRLWKMGRNFGIGVSLISPRPAEINKGCLNLTEHMFCGKLKGPQDRKAIEGWASDQGADRQPLERLPTLPTGELVMWSDAGPKIVRFRNKQTFDSSKTPEADDVRPSTLPTIDLDQVRKAMASAIETAAANDPKKLKARIADLERQLEARSPNPEAAATIADLMQQLRAFGGATPAEVTRLRDLEKYFEIVIGAVDAYRQPGGRAKAPALVIGPADDRTVGILKDLAKADRIVTTADPPSSMRVAASPARRARIAPRPEESVAGEMPSGCRAVLSVLANFNGGNSKPLGCSVKKAAIMCGYAPGGSTMRGILARLRKEGWIELGGEPLIITPAGLQALGSFDPLPTGAKLREHWLNSLPTAAARLLAAVIASHPRALTQADLETWTKHDGLGDSYVAGGSTMRGGLARLRALDLVVTDRSTGAISVTPDLF